MCTPGVVPIDLLLLTSMWGEQLHQLTLSGGMESQLGCKKILFLFFPQHLELFRGDVQICPLIQRSPVRFLARSHTGVMDYDEACFMHLTPGVVHNFPKAVGV